MSLTINQTTPIDYPSEDEAFKAFQVLADKGLIQNLQKPTGDVFSFVTDREQFLTKYDEIQDVIHNSAEFAPFLGIQKAISHRSIQRPTDCWGKVEYYTREGTSEEKQLAETNDLRIGTFDTLMQGIDALSLGSTDKWIAMNAGTSEAWDALSKAIKDYTANITILSGIEWDDKLYYKPNAACVARYRKVLERVLLTLANHPVGRQTVIATLCATQETLKDLPFEVVITPRINAGRFDDFGEYLYSHEHYLQLGPNVLDFWPVVRHELGHLVLRTYGLDLDMSYHVKFKLLGDLFGCDDETYALFKDACRKSSIDVSESETVQLPNDWGLYLPPYQGKPNECRLYEVYNALAFQACFPNAMEMSDIIGVNVELMNTAKGWNTPYLIINRLSDFAFFEKVRWGYSGSETLKYLSEKVQAKLASTGLSGEERSLFENAKNLLDVFNSLKNWSFLPPKQDAFKRLCQLHERDTHTQYIEDRFALRGEDNVHIESNVRKMDGWDPKRIA